MTEKPFLRICLVSYRGNPHCGGQGVYVSQLARALKGLGHSVHVLSGDPPPKLDQGIGLTVLSGLNLYSADHIDKMAPWWRLKHPLNFYEWWTNSTLGYPEPLAFGVRAYHYLKRHGHRFDIIHDNQSLSWGILKISRLYPTVATIHHPMTRDRDIAVMSTRSFVKRARVMRWYSFINMQKRVARKLPAILTVSDASKRDILSDYGVFSSRMHVIPVGIDTHRCHPVEGIERDPNRIIVTNSADSPLKGLYYLMHAVAELRKKRPVRLRVIGSPRRGGVVESLVAELSLEEVVEFTGRISDERFAREYARAKVAVVPSLYEGFGLPVGEAMACGVPVVCTDGGALPEVAGDAARIVPTGDSGALAEALQEMLDNEVLANRFAERGIRRVAERFDWQLTARKSVGVYRGVIKEFR